MSQQSGNGTSKGAVGGSLGSIRAGEGEGIDASDPLARKHRSDPFARNWRSVNYARLNGPAGRETDDRAVAPASRLLRSDWSPSARPIPERDAKPYAAQFASFTGGPFHAEVERLAPGEKARDTDAPSDDDL